MKCLTWNLEWAPKVSTRSILIKKLIGQVDPDVVCYTEVLRNFIHQGHSLESEPDYGYNHTGERRKVVLWSKNHWTDPDTFGDPDLPSGRFVSGITKGIRFVGICIPWKDAHVRTGRKDRHPWEDHLTYCAGLGRIISRYSSDNTPLCVLGDYNQRIPRTFQPKKIADALLDSMPENIKIATEGIQDSEGKYLIDHIGVTSSLNAMITQILPRITSGGVRLSDHVGVVCQITKK